MAALASLLKEMMEDVVVLTSREVPNARMNRWQGRRSDTKAGSDDVCDVNGDHFEGDEWLWDKKQGGADHFHYLTGAAAKVKSRHLRASTLKDRTIASARGWGSKG